MWPRRKSWPFISPCPPAIVMLWLCEYAATIFSLSTPRGGRTAVSAGLGVALAKSSSPSASTPARVARASRSCRLNTFGSPSASSNRQRLAQANHDRHGGREAHLVLGHVLQLVGEVEVELRQGRAPGLPPGLLAERAEPDARRQHEALLRARHHEVDAPGVHRADRRCRGSTPRRRSGSRRADG